MQPAIYTITLPGKPRLYHPTPLPPGWETVGEISCLAEIIDGQELRRHGALVRAAATGMYACASAGTITALDQRQVALALAATVPGVDLDGDLELTAAEAAPLVGRSALTIRDWHRKGYLAPSNPDGPGPAKYRKADVLAAANRTVALGRPKKPR